MIVIDSHSANLRYFHKKENNIVLDICRDYFGKSTKVQYLPMPSRESMLRSTVGRATESRAVIADRRFPLSELIS